MWSKPKRRQVRKGGVEAAARHGDDPRERGGKDGTSFPVDRKAYDRTIDVMKKAIESAKVGNSARLEAIRRPARFYEI